MNCPFVLNGSKSHDSSKEELGEKHRNLCSHSRGAMSSRCTVHSSHGLDVPVSDWPGQFEKSEAFILEKRALGSEVVVLVQASLAQQTSPEIFSRHLKLAYKSGTNKAKVGIW